MHHQPIVVVLLHLLFSPSHVHSAPPARLLEKRVLEDKDEWKQHVAQYEHRRQLTGTVGELILHPNDTIPHRGGACFDSWECSWYYHTRHPGFWGDCDQGTCLCQPGYKGAHCERAPPANRFSCSDGQCYNPTANGRQSEERGGNLTITVVKMTNLPDKDGFSIFGGETDAFVEVVIGQLDEFGK